MIKTFVLLLFAWGTFGATYNVSNGTSSDLISAISACSDRGDTITFSSGLVIPISSQINIGKSIYFKGCGDNRLKTTDSTKFLISYADANQGAISVYGGAGLHRLRFSNIIFDKDVSSYTACNSIRLTATLTISE